MKILDFDLDINKVSDNQIKLAEIIKTLIYNEDDEVLDLIDFENNAIFLQPALFDYFLESENKVKQTNLRQFLIGYYGNQDYPMHKNSLLVTKQRLLKPGLISYFLASKQ